MSDQKYFLINKDELEQILNKIRRLPWDDANEIMAIIKDLKRVNVEEKTKEEAPFTNKFSGTRVLPNGVVWVLRFTNSWYVADDP